MKYGKFISMNIKQPTDFNGKWIVCIFNRLWKNFSGTSTAIHKISDSNMCSIYSNIDLIWKYIRIITVCVSSLAHLVYTMHACIMMVDKWIYGVLHLRSDQCASACCRLDGYHHTTKYTHTYWICILWIQTMMWLWVFCSNRTAKNDVQFRSTMVTVPLCKVQSIFTFCSPHQTYYSKLNKDTVLTKKTTCSGKQIKCKFYST